MPDYLTLMLAVFAYFQAVLLALGYIYYRRLGNRRAELLAHEEDILLRIHRLEKAVSGLQAHAGKPLSQGNNPSSSPKREQVLRLAAEGTDPAVIARQVGMSPPAVRLLARIEQLRAVGPVTEAGLRMAAAG